MRKRRRAFRNLVCPGPNVVLVVKPAGDKAGGLALSDPMVRIIRELAEFACECLCLKGRVRDSFGPVVAYSVVAFVRDVLKKPKAT